LTEYWGSKTAMSEENDSDSTNVVASAEGWRIESATTNKHGEQRFRLICTNPHLLFIIDHVAALEGQDSTVLLHEDSAVGAIAQSEIPDKIIDKLHELPQHEFSDDEIMSRTESL
jgi:hypothetical protein